MRLFREEMKKIWRWPIVALLLSVNLLFFFMMIADQLDYSYNEEGEQRVLADLRSLVGDTLEPEELPVAHELLNEYYADVTAIMNSDPAFAEAGLTDSRQLWEIEDRLPGETEEEAEARLASQFQLQDAISFGEYLHQSDYAFWKIQALSMFIEEYEVYEDKSGFENLFSVRFSQVPVQHFERLAETGAHRNLFSSRSYGDTTMIITLSANLITMSIGILVLPYLTADNQQSMTQMQWTTKTGRRTLRTQFAAVMTSVCALMIVQIVILLGLFLAHRQDYFSLLGQRIFGLLGGGNPIVINPQFGHFTAIAVTLCIFVNIGAACIFFVLSHRNVNYVMLLLKALPAAAVLCFTGGMMSLWLLFSAENAVYRFVGIRGMEIVLAGLVLITGALLCIATLRGVRRRELL